jgi:tetratricopeptide (TPR) repeat protein
MCNLTLALYRTGRFNEAVAMARRCLATQRRATLEDSQDTINIMVALVIGLRRQGKSYVKETRETVEIARRVLGEGHKGTLNWITTLAFALEEAGNLGDAKALRKEEIALRIKHQGENSWLTLWAMNRYAVLLWKMGKLDEAEEINREVFKRWRSVLGPEHTQTLAAMSNLALIFEDRGKLVEAEALREEELKIRRSVIERKRAGRQIALPRVKELPVPRSPGTLVYDDFDGRLALDWKIQNPDAVHLSLTANPGTLTITTQQGSFSGSSKDYENLFLIDSPAAPDEDFQFTTRISFFPLEADSHRAGLICYDDDDNYLAFSLEWSCYFGGPVFNVWAETEGQPAQVNFPLLYDSKTVSLRVAKKGNRYTFSTSYDGKAFTQRIHPLNYETGQFHRGIAWGDGSVRRIGLFAINGPASGAPEIDASFDFFEVRSLPTEAEAVAEMASAPESENDGQTP